MGRTYVVFEGRNPGVYNKWSEAHAQVKGFSNACFQGYDSRKDAEEAFNSSVHKPTQVPNSNEANSSTSTSTESSTPNRNHTKKLVELLKQLSDLSVENRALGLKMENLSQEIGKLVDEMDNKQSATSAASAT